MQRPKFFSKKKSDSYFLEVVAMIIFITGFNYKVVQNKWKGTCKAFDSFYVEKVAKYDEERIKKLLENPEIIRNQRKIRAIINNAKKIRQLITEHGSMMKWINKITKDYEKSPILSQHPFDAGMEQFELIGKHSIKWFFLGADKEFE